MKVIILLGICITLIQPSNAIGVKKTFTKTKALNLGKARLKLRKLFDKIRCKQKDDQLKCIDFVRNYDGDTITVNIPNVHSLIGDEISVRLLGIDTAEVRTSDECEKDMANKAKDYVYEQLKDVSKYHLKLIAPERDKYFRIAADVQIKGESLSRKLVEEGLAYPYDGDSKPEIDWCRPLDEQVDISDFSID